MLLLRDVIAASALVLAAEGGRWSEETVLRTNDGREVPVSQGNSKPLEPVTIISIRKLED